MSSLSDEGLTSNTENRGSSFEEVEEVEIDWENFDKVKISELKLADNVLNRLHEWIERGEKPEWSEILVRA